MCSPAVNKNNEEEMRRQRSDTQLERLQATNVHWNSIS